MANALKIVDLSGQYPYLAKGQLSSVQGLVVHHTATPDTATPQSIAQGWKQSGNSSQYVMGRDGTIYQMMPSGSKAYQIKPSWNPSIPWANNSTTEGIELIAKDNSDVTPAQTAALRQFALQQAQQYGFDPATNVVGHGEVNGTGAPAGTNPTYLRQSSEGMTPVSALRSYLAANPTVESQYSPTAEAYASAPSSTGALAAISQATSPTAFPSPLFASGQEPTSTDVASMYSGIIPRTTTPGLQDLAPSAMNGVSRLVPGQRAVLPTDFATDTGAPDLRTLAMASQPSSILPSAFAGSRATGNAVAPPQVTFAGNGLSSQPTDFQQGNQDILGLLAGLAGAGGTSAAVRAVNAQQPTSAFAGSSATGQAKQSPFNGAAVTGNADSIIPSPSYPAPTTQYTTKAMTEANPAYEAYIKAQNADDIGSGPGSFSSLGSLNTPSIVPPKTITVNQRVPLAPASIPLSSLGTVNPMSQILPNVASGFSSTPIGHIVQAVSGEPVSGGLLGLLFGGGTPSVLSQLTSAMQPTAAPAFPNSAGNGPVVGAKKTPDGYTTFNGDNGVPGNSGNWFNQVTGNA